MRKHPLLCVALFLLAAASALAAPPLTFMPAAATTTGKVAAHPTSTRVAMEKRAARAKSIIRHWTKEKIASAKTRDLVMPPKTGTAFVDFVKPSTRSDKGLTTKGPTVGKAVEAALAHLLGQNDRWGPKIRIVSPGRGATSMSETTFSADVTDNSGVQRVVFIFKEVGKRRRYRLPAAYTGGNTYSLTTESMPAGDWKFKVLAIDNVLPLHSRLSRLSRTPNPKH